MELNPNTPKVPNPAAAQYALRSVILYTLARFVVVRQVLGEIEIVINLRPSDGKCNIL